MNLNNVLLEGRVYNVKLCQIQRGEDSVTLVKADFVQPSRQRGRLIPRFLRIPVEFWACKMAERLVDGDNVCLGLSELVMYEQPKEQFKVKRYAIRVKEFTFINKINTLDDEKEALCDVSA